MDQEGLKKFVSNMRSQGVEDEEIARNLEIAGHPTQTIDILLGRTPDTVTAKQAADAAQAPPSIDPNNRPQIIKDRSSVLKQEAAAQQPAAVPVEQPTDPSMAAPEPAPQQPMPTAQNKVVIAPTTPGMEAAHISSPTTAAVPEPEVAPQPEAAPTPTPAPIEQTPVQGMPQPVSAENTTPSTPATPVTNSIYPESQTLRGHAPVAPTQAQNLAPNITVDDASHVVFNSNPLSMLGFATSRFIRYIPIMLALLVYSVILAFLTLRLTDWVGSSIIEWVVSQEWIAEIFSDSPIGAAAFLLSIITVIYVVIGSLFLTVWRSVPLSVALDIGRDDKPELGGAFNKVITWFGRLFSANLRLAIKVALVIDVFVMAAVVLLDTQGFGAFQWLPYLYYAALLATQVVLIRNAFMHLMMLSSSSTQARNAARDSIQLVHQPRIKYFELLAWTGVFIILAYVVRVLVLLITEYDPSTSLAALDVIIGGRDLNTEWIYELLALLFIIVLYLIFELGLARYFVASQHTIRTARQMGPISIINFIVILLAALTIWGGNWLVNEIQINQLNSSFDGGGTRDESGFYTPDPDDQDDNGIPDDEQCEEDEIAFATVVEYNEDERRFIYEIECF